MGRNLESKPCVEPALIVAVVLPGGGGEEVGAILSQLPGATSVVLWRTEGDPLHGAKPSHAGLAESHFVIQTLADGSCLEAGVLYVVPASSHAWFEGTRLRVRPRVAEEPAALQHFLSSLGQGWGPRGSALLSQSVGGEGTPGAEELRAAGGLAFGPPAFTAVPGELLRVLNSQAGSGPRENEARRLPHSSGTRSSLRGRPLFTFPPSLLEAARAAAATAALNTTDRGRLRAWVPGCGTGTLVYSMAMLLAEAAANSGSQLQVFGTDHDEHALTVARTGRYPAQAALGMDPDLRGRYTFDEGDTIRVSEALREMCVFSRHELTQEAPLSRMDLLICNRVFEGLAPARRATLIDSLYFALREGGLLLTLDHVDYFPEDRFEPVQGGFLRTRAVRAVRAKALPPAQAPAQTRSSPPPAAAGETSAGSSARPELQEWDFSRSRLAEERVEQVRTHNDLERFVRAMGVPLLLCDQELHLLHMSEEAQAAFNLADADCGARLEELAIHLPGGIELLQAAQRALAAGATQELSIRTERQVYLARISAAALAAGRGLAIVFSDVTALEEAKAQAVAQRHQQAAVARVGDLALSMAGSEEVFEEALSVLFGNVPVCSSGIILERSGDDSELEVVAARGFGADPLATLRSLGEPAKLLDAVLEREAPMVHPAAVKRAPGRAEALPGVPAPGKRARSAPFNSALPFVAGGIACPIIHEGNVLGVIALYSRQQGIDALEHQHFVQAVANVLGGAIARRRTRRRLALELEVSAVLARSSDLGAVGEGVRHPLRAALSAREVELWVKSTTLPPAWAREVPSAGAVATPPWAATLSASAAVSYQAQAGAGSACELLVPVLRGQDVVAALRLTGAQLRAPDAELSQGLLRIAGMIADFLGRLEIVEALKQSEASYRQSSAEFEALHASLPVGISMHDSNGSIRRVNRHLAELETPQGSAARGALSRLYSEEVPAWIQRVLTSGTTIRDVELSVTAGAEIRSWLCSFAPIRGSDGTLFGACAVVQDISSLKHVEAGLREADRQKDDFLAMLGHELRNPMAAIRNATELLSRVDQATPQLLRLQGIFDRQTLHTTKLIDGLLDVARVARGKVDLTILPVQVAELVRQVVEDRRHQFRERRVDVQLPEQELWVAADRVRMVQILDNLLSNSLKFTHIKGRIAIEVRHSGGRGSIRITDDGMGIEAELLPSIFEPFRQGRATLAQSQGGLGLGLALVKGLIELHGFQLRAESVGPGRGASFLVEFPLAAAPEQAAPESRMDARHLRLLLVEDNPDISETLVELLGEAGHAIAAVGTGEEALVALRSQQPDIVLCDIGLPGMDGLTLATLVRADAALKDLKLIAMTGFGDSTTRARIESAGFDRYLIKPVQLEALWSCLLRLAAAPAQRVNRR